MDGRSVVVLVNCVGGGELAVVRDILVTAHHIPTVLIERGQLESLSVTLDLDTGLLDVHGVLVRPAVVWIRHGAAGALLAHHGPAGGLTPLDADSWLRLFNRMAESAVVGLPGAAPLGTAQLGAAKRLGVRVPNTVVTTDVRAAAGRLAASRIIVKLPDFRLFEPDRRRWAGCAPMVLDRSSVTGAEVPGGRPVVVQEFVPHVRELRVYYLNGAIAAFEVRKSAPSSQWTASGDAGVTQVDCPPSVIDAVRLLGTAWKLRYGAFDLLVVPGGEPVFLELNADGDWLWYERKARWHGISFMAAVMVHELYVRSIS